MSDRAIPFEVVDAKEGLPLSVAPSTHLLIGYRNGDPVNDEPFDEIRLIEHIGTNKELKYKGLLK